MHQQEATVQPQLLGEDGGGNRVVGSHRTGGDNAAVSLVLGVPQEELELADLPAAIGRGDPIVVLHP
jgi:hypothetical protein